MATWTEPDMFSEDIANKIYDFNSDACRLVLTNTTPSPSATFTLALVTQIATGGGYTQMVDGSNGMGATTLSFARTGQVTTVSGTQVVFTATGAVATFQWVVWIDDTPTSPANPVMGWINHGTAITMANTDTYTVPAGALFTIN